MPSPSIRFHRHAAHQINDVPVRLFRFTVDHDGPWDENGALALYTFDAGEMLLDAFYQNTESWTGPDAPDLSFTELGLRVKEIDITDVANPATAEGQGASMNVFGQQPLVMDDGDVLQFRHDAELENGGVASPTTGAALVFALVGTPSD